ncbi:hypothetical protein AAKU67_004050 [Oxalobacteraceae bacterium GrIS 2.11]
MNSSNLFRSELVKNYVALHAEKGADGLIILWERIVVEIVVLVGNGGFNALFDRCIGLTQNTFPWLIVAAPLPLGGDRITELRLRFAEQSTTQAAAANNQLLTTFTDLLASLVGEQITVVILHTAMGKSEANGAKESKNE